VLQMDRALQAAILSDNISIVKSILSIIAPTAGRSIPHDGSGRPIIESAIYSSLRFINPSFHASLDMLKLLLEAGANLPNDSYETVYIAEALRYPFCTLLQRAIFLENLEMANFLIRNGINLNTPAGWSRGADLYLSGRSALQAAVAIQSFELVDLLLGAGADVNSPAANPTGATALQFACQRNNLKMVKVLIDAGADINASPAPVNGATALQFAAANGNFDMVQLLLLHKARINAPPAMICGFTALEGAAVNGRLDMVQYLLSMGADISGPFNPQYGRAVGLAWRNGHITLANYLQEQKLSIDSQEPSQTLESILEAPDVRFWGSPWNWIERWTDSCFSSCGIEPGIMIHGPSKVVDGSLKSMVNLALHRGLERPS